MLIKDIQRENVQYVDPETPLTEVAQLMKKHDCGSILVGEDDKLSGVVTDRDIVMRCIAESANPASMTAGECQTPEVLYCYETSDVEDVLHNMAETKVRRMPVLDSPDSKQLVGIVSFGDLAAACEHKEVAGKTMEEIRQAA